MGENERRAADQARADRDRIDAGAKALRHSATQDAYAGLAKPEVAYGLASILDLLGLHYRDIPEPVRREALAVAAMLSGDKTA